MEESSIPDHPGRGSTKMCSVLFVDIVGYSKKTNAEQIVLKQQFVSLWAKAIKDVPPDDIMVVDAGDGAALTALVEPEDTIRVAMALREATEEHNKHATPLDIRMGINFGPVQLSMDVHGKSCIVGDAINIAQRIMSFADAGQITISRSYYDVIKPLAHKYEEMFYYLGQRSDKHVRYHHIYGLGQRGEAAPLGNAVSEGLRPIKDQEPVEEVRTYAAPKAFVPKKEAVPPKAVSQPPPRVSFTSKVLRFFVSIFRSMRRSLKSLFWWARLVGVFLFVAYEMMQLMPLLGTPDALKKEVGSQASAVTQFVKSGFGLMKQEAQSLSAQDGDKSVTAAAQAAEDEHPAKKAARQNVPKGN